MIDRFSRAALVVLAASPGFAFAQAGSDGWFYECIDPENTTPYSSPSGGITIGNDLMGIQMGVVGTVTYGGQNGPCYSGARTLNFEGRFCLFVPGAGSQQSDFDDGLALTVGAPADAVGDYTYAKIIRYTDPTASATDKMKLFGEGGLQAAFSGASKRYFIAVYRDGNSETSLETRVIGDAARLRWRMKNISTTEVTYLGLRYGSYVGMRTRTPDVLDASGANQANSSLGTATGIPKPRVVQSDGTVWVGFNTTPTTKPLRLERAFSSLRSDFPAYVNFMFGQQDAYGLRVDNAPTDTTPDATRADHFIVCNQFPNLWDNAMTVRVWEDQAAQGDPVLDANADPILEQGDQYLDETSYIQTFAPQAVAPGSYRDIIMYLRSPWSVGDYRDPYSVVLDAPRLVASGDSADLNGLTPNPMQIYCHVDNQYATADKEIPLTDVRCTIFLPEGLSLANGESQVKKIASIPANELRSISWDVEADGDTTGKLQYSVRVEPNVGPTRTLTGNILVSATPRVRLAEGPNLITFPWQFGDSNLDTILGLQAGIDYAAYQWNPTLGEYVPVTSVTRGQGVWIVPKQDQGLVDLTGSSAPSDAANGGGTVDLKRGWNMIGNPYQYPIPISQLLAIVADDAADTLSWTQLVDAGYVNSSLAYWQRNAEDPNSGSYVFTEGSSDYIQPNRGYWVYNNTYNSIKIIFPAVFAETLPGSTRATKASGSAWKQTDKQWRLQLVARDAKGMDSSNFVGVAQGEKLASRLRLNEPPTSPSGGVQLAIEESVDGAPTRLAQDLAPKLSRKEWKVVVTAQEAGEVTVTWPNVASIPRNVRMQLVDKATNLTRDIRFASGYTFKMDQAGTREFTLQMEPGAPVRAVIGDVVVTKPSRDARAPFTINYSLSAPATTTIRILAGSGKEIYTVSRGRADRVGENSATWAMRDNANRAVAPGSYQVEIIAETDGGDRVRKIIPINVVR
ncbi:MAG: hypothetical protein JST40_06260 [Armatimonadetes bacterium]|nr:hypothetical protein [Armatimonadota bacterium]